MFTSVPDPEAEQLRVRFFVVRVTVLQCRATSCRIAAFNLDTRKKTDRGSRFIVQRVSAEKYIANKLVPLLASVHGISVRHAVLRFATDADSVGRVICTNAEELGAAMIVLPTHGKGAPVTLFACCHPWLTWPSRPPSRALLRLDGKLLHASLARASFGAALRRDKRSCTLEASQDSISSVARLAAASRKFKCTTASTRRAKSDGL